MKRIIKQVFPQTVPVMAGYISLGIAFGLLLQSIGYGPIWAFLMGVFIYAGSAQFLAVELLAAGAENAAYIEPECPHYVQDYKYQDIAEKIKLFLTEENL